MLDMFNEPKYVAEVKELVKNRMDLADFKSSCHAATSKSGFLCSIKVRPRSLVSRERYLKKFVSSPFFYRLS